MAWNAILLAGAGILCRFEHLGLKASTNSKLGIGYLVATVLFLLEVCADRCRGSPHCWVLGRHCRTWRYVAQTQRGIRLRRFLKHQRLVE